VTVPLELARSGQRQEALGLAATLLSVLASSAMAGSQSAALAPAWLLEAWSVRRQPRSASGSEQASYPVGPLLLVDPLVLSVSGLDHQDVVPDGGAVAERARPLVGADRLARERLLAVALPSVPWLD
jgi:hypothetical protein